MVELRLVEHYSSIQCEGPRTGLPTQFVRLAGCNMRCPGWPCDTQHAIDPKIYRNASYHRSGQALIEDCMVQGPNNICLTGGEPLLQDNVHMQEFAEGLGRIDMTLEVFTNGSYAIPKWLRDTAIFMLDWKLEGSGEAQTRIDQRIENAARLDRRDGIKFVVTNVEDIDEAQETMHELLTFTYNGASSKPTFWIAPAWDKMDPAELVKIVLERRLEMRVNIQMHKYIWPADMQGV